LILLHEPILLLSFVAERIEIMKYIFGCALLLILGLTPRMAIGAKLSPNPDIQIVPASALPVETQQPAQDVLLYSNRFYDAWLYLEQKHGSRLLVLDVSEPSKIRLVATVSTGLTKPFYLVPVPRKRYAIARFRDGSGEELLDLTLPRAPRLTAASMQFDKPCATESSVTYPGVELRVSDSVAGEGQDVVIVQPGKAPLLIATVPHVTHRTFRSATGTLFLIGEQGLTVVRQHSAELAWQRPFVDDQFHD
jgi:hypothetical protein